MPVDKLFTEDASGRDTQRPQLIACLQYLRAGDTLVVHSMDRLARNLDDRRELVRDLATREVAVEFVQEHLTFSGDESLMAILFLSLMGDFSEFERALILERRREGIALAKATGKYHGDRPPETADYRHGQRPPHDVRGVLGLSVRRQSVGPLQRGVRRLIFGA